MTPVELLVDVEGAGVVLAVRCGRLAWDAPAGVVGEREVGLLREHKAELIRLLLERTRTPAKVVFEAVVEPVPDPMVSVTWKGPATAVWATWSSVGEGRVDDDPGLRATCLVSAEACGWPALPIPGRPAETVAGGEVAWTAFCVVVEVGLVGAALEVLPARRGVSVKGGGGIDAGEG